MSKQLVHAFAALLITTSIASADTVSGWGTRGAYAFGGEVFIAPTGDTKGQFTIVLDLPDGTHTSCRYHQFSDGKVTGTVAEFTGLGYCRGPGGWYWSRNRFAIGDHGSPGALVDTIDVNFIGPSGITIPGGTIDSGDLAVTP